MLNSRNFVQSLGLIMASRWRAIAGRITKRPASAVSNPDVRRAEALELRRTLAVRQASISAIPQTPNGDEGLVAHIASFSKGLPHQQNGEVDDAAHLKAHANAYAERFVRSIKESCLDRMIFFGEDSLRKGIDEFVQHYHGERNHQGLGNRLIVSDELQAGQRGAVLRRERLGGILNYYYRAAA